MSACITQINRSGYQPPDSSFAAMHGTEWKENKPFKHEHYVGAPKTGFDIHLVEDDSVTIYYTDLQGLLIGEPLKTLIKKGSYRYEPHFKSILPGIYLQTCLIGETKHKSKILLVK